jgi:hypothetical protein
MATHGIFSTPAVDRLKNPPIDEIVVTNTLPVPEDATELPNLTVLSIAPFLADTLKAILTDSSVSSIFMGRTRRQPYRDWQADLGSRVVLGPTPFARVDRGTHRRVSRYATP